MSHHDHERRQRDREERERERAERQRERARRRAERDRHHAERKGKVLHTRISEQLSDDIRRMAEELRVPVSNLVRNVLEETFSVVETVSENVGELLDEVLDEAELTRGRFRGRRPRRRWHRDAGPVEAEEAAEAADAAEVAEAADAEPDAVPRPEFPDVLGWQPLLLNRDADCADCGRGVPRGERAFVGVGAQGLSSTVLCRECTEARD